MPKPARFPLALLAVSAAAPLSLALVGAPAAHADEKPVPPGLTSMPHASVAVAYAPPATDAHGRKLR